MNVVFQDKFKAMSEKQVKEFHSGNPDALNPEMSISDQAHLLPYQSQKWEFPEKSLRMGIVIGECGKSSLAFHQNLYCQDEK